MKFALFCGIFCVVAILSVESCPLFKRQGYVGVAGAAIAEKATEEEAERILNSVINVQGSFARCPYPDGLFPVPYDCSRFVSCANGIGREMSCSPGTIFSPRLRICVTPNLEDCPSLGTYH